MWDRLRSVAGRQAPWLRAPLPAGPGCCAVCRGPARPGFRRCYQCALHRHDAAGMLADVVVPVSYSVAGTGYARALWLYKSDAPDRDAARRALRAMLLVFLHDHGRCVWARARMAAPTHVAVVPSGRGRPGTHPLRTLVQPYLALPRADLAVCAREPVQARDLDPGRFRVPARLGGASVLLLDDTWTSGSSAQSAAIALKRAGARQVAVVTLGRHVHPRNRTAGSLPAVLAGRRFRPDVCAVHGTAARSAAGPGR
jgi:hypothetical protein